MKTKLTTLILFFLIVNSYAQVEDAWVYFNDKPSKTTLIPSDYLTERSIDRRNKYNIPFDFKDVPIEASYVATIASATGISVKAKSKWLNALHIQGTKVDIDLLLVNHSSIISSIEYANRSLNISSKPLTSKKIVKIKDKFKIEINYDYGSAFNQVDMLNVEVLHQNNFTGDGMYIAIMDAGFPGVESFTTFKRLRDRFTTDGVLNIKGYDYVNRDDTFFEGNSHGTSVLSTIAGYLKNGEDGAVTDFVGSAPDAEFCLFITEDNDNEVRLEESLWVEAAEKADSLGVDVINTSLGYSVFFDNPDHNYAASDMDGKTTFITRGAEVAFSRGIILVTSAGNEGTDPDWPYINAPADGPSVLTIGAVDSAGVIADFSSYGLTLSQKKPDVCAQGVSSVVVNSLGTGVTGLNGTSFSSPIMAGAVACLWQALPNKTNAEITQLIRESAHLFNNFNLHEGYGIPNFEAILDTLNVDKVIKEDEIYLYPNPAKTTISVFFSKEIDEVELTIFDLLGSVILNSKIEKNNPILSVEYLPNGVYLTQVKSNNEVKIIKLLKN